MKTYVLYAVISFIILGFKMDKKLFVVSILVIVMLVTISLVSATNAQKIEKKESPLFKIRTQKAVNRENLKERIITMLFAQRILWIPPILRNYMSNQVSPKTHGSTSCPFASYCKPCV